MKMFGVSRLALVIAGTGMVAACGGGGGGTRSTPTPTPAPAPAPAPRATPTQAELDAETAGSNFVLTSGADTAHAQGATGAGELIAIMDTGALGFLENLDDNSGTGPNADDLVFEDRLHPESKSLWGTDTPGDFTQHGTLVTAVIGAARDGRGITGIAYEADLLYYDYGDYCLDSYCNEDEWQESFERYRVGMQEAIDLGATVINFSLSEERFPVRMIETTANAVAADMVIVISAGNDSDADPSPMAVGFADLAPDHTIIAGALELDNETPASFTAHAGVAMDNYLMAQGVSVTTYNNNGDLTAANGTSLSAPIISGAVALLAEAFPNLTGAEIVDILFESAIDAGEPGVDPIYGQGILDLDAAFQPLGTTSVAGTGREALSLFGSEASFAMGDASAMLKGVSITDKYDRVFSADLGGFARRAGLSTPLRSLAQEGVESRALSIGNHRLAVATGKQAGLSGQDPIHSLLSAEIDVQLDPTTRIAFATGRGLDGLAEPQGGVSTQFLTDGPVQRDGFHARDRVAMASAHRIAGIDVVAGAEVGQVARTSVPWLADTDERYRRMGLAAAVGLGPVSLKAGVTRLEEDETVLGGSLAMLGDGATSHFVDLAGGLSLGDWTLRADWRRGQTRLAGSDDLFAGGSVTSEGWQMALAQGPFAFRVAQPLRVRSGGLDALVPVTFDYTMMLASTEERLISLAPSGREIDVEAAFGWRLGAGRIDANLYWRKEPGHIAAMPDDRGVALRLSSPL